MSTSLSATPLPSAPQPLSVAPPPPPLSPPVEPILPPTGGPASRPVEGVESAEGVEPMATTQASAATQPAAAVAPPITPGQFAVSAAFCLMIALAGLAVARAAGWWRDARWSPSRCPTLAASGPLWLGLGAMVLVGFVIVPATLASLGWGGRPAAGVPRTADDDARQMVAIALAYAGGLLAMAGVHAVGDRRTSLVRLGLADGPSPTGEPSSPGRSWRRGPIVVVLVALPILVALTNLAMVVAQFVWSLLDYQHSSAHALLQLMQRAEARPGVLVLAIVNAVVLAPVFEEVFFRGHLQTALTGLFPKRWPAILITSLLFAVMHEPWTIPAILVLSLIVGYVYERTGNLWVAIGLHVGFNGASTALFLATRGGA